MTAPCGAGRKAVRSGLISVLSCQRPEPANKLSEADALIAGGLFDFFQPATKSDRA